MNVRWLIAQLVPRWTGDQALLAVNLLQQAIDAVWEVHGDAMAAVLFEPETEESCDVEEDTPF